MEAGSEQTITVNGVEYLRVPIVAELRLSPVDQMPTDLQEQVRSVAARLNKQHTDDMVWVNMVLDSEGINANRDYMPRSSLVKSFASARWKPFNVDHVIAESASMIDMVDRNKPPVKNTIFGVMTSATLSDINGDPLTSKQVESLDLADVHDRAKADRVAVNVWAGLYAFYFPKTVQDLMKAISSNRMHVSMERWISDLDYMVFDSTGKYELVDRATADKTGIQKAWASMQEPGGGPVVRRTKSFVYGAGAATRMPANTSATFVDASREAPRMAVASRKSTILKNLDGLDRELQLKLALSQYDDPIALIKEHEGIVRAAAAVMSLTEDEAPPNDAPNSTEATPTPDQEIGSMTTPATPAPTQTAALAAQVPAPAINVTETGFETVVAQREQARASLAKAATDLELAKAEATKATAELAQAKADLAKANEQIKSLTEAKVTLEKDKAEVAKANTDLLAQIAKANTERTIAHRKAELTKLGEKFATETRITRVVAAKEDGSLAMDDATFEMFMGEWTEAAKASAAAPAPAPAPAAKTAVTPAAPDLTAAKTADAVRAAASLNGEAAPTDSPTTRMAKLFPLEIQGS